MSKTVATFVQKVGLIFTSVIQDTNVIVGLKLLTTAGFLPQGGSGRPLRQFAPLENFCPSLKFGPKTIE